MTDFNELKSMVKLFNSSSSMEEFAVNLDLFGSTIDEFNAAYHQHVGSAFPMLFCAIAGKKLNSHASFDIVGIAKSTGWKIQLPMQIHFDGKHLEIKFEHSIGHCYLNSSFEEYAVDPIAYLCYSAVDYIVKKG